MAPRNRSAARGHAWAGFALALVLLAGTIVVMQGLLLPTNSGATAAIWYISAGALLIGMLFAFRDARWLGKEWRALAELNTGERDPDAFFSRVESKLSRDPKPLVIERADAVRMLRGNAAHTAPADYRTHYRREAQASSSHIASATRFLSSALLLLAVIGTFAGMKAAIPQLIEHIRNSGAVADSTDASTSASRAAAEPTAAEPDSGAAPRDSTLGGAPGPTVPERDPFLGIGNALSPVADAFGANFLALLGALALGVASFGAMEERRRLLHELDRFSEDTLYRFIPPGASADRLAQAVEQMRLNIDSVRGVSEGIRSLQGSLGTFERTLRDAIEGLRSSFAQTVQQQSNEIQAQLNQTVGKVVVSMQDISVALGTTATAYEGLVAGLRERDLGVSRAATELERIGKRLDDSMGRSAAALLAAGSDLKVTAETIANHVTDTDKSITAAAHSLEGAAASISETLARHTDVLERTPVQLEAALQAQGAAVTQAVDTHASRVAGTLTELRGAVEKAGPTLEVIAERQTTLRGEIAGVANVMQQEGAESRNSLAQQIASRLDTIRSEFETLRRQVDLAVSNHAAAASDAGEARQAVLNALNEMPTLLRGLVPILADAIRQDQTGTTALGTELVTIRQLVDSALSEYKRNNGSQPTQAGDR